MAAMTVATHERRDRTVYGDAALFRRDNGAVIQ